MDKKKIIYGITIAILIVVTLWSYFNQQSQWFFISASLAFAIAFFKKQLYEVLKSLRL